MKFIKILFLSTFIILFFETCSSDDDVIVEGTSGLDPEQSYNLTNIAYATESDRQVFDIYLPANRTTDTKTIILVHGGSWVSGDKGDMEIFKDAILSQYQDFAIVSMNYRYANANNLPYPMQTNDITSLVNYLNENRTNYTISDKIGFVGTSAGGHLSLLWSYTLDANNQVEMVCSIVGPTNFTDEAYINSTEPQVQALLQLFDFANQEPAFLMEASPYHQVTTSAPPTSLFYGGNDPLVPNSQGMDLRDRLVELGITHEFTFYPEEGHGWVGASQLDTANKLLAFIGMYM